MNDLMNGLMNAFSVVEWFNGLMNDLKNDLMKASFNYWVK